MTSFHDLADYVAIPRVTALRLSPDGSWLAAAVQTVGSEPKYVTSIWRIAVPGDAAPAEGDPGPGGSPARAAAAQGGPVRLTRSAEGEGGPEFLPDGSVLFVSKRPDPVTTRRAPGARAGGPDGEAGQDKPALWLLPAGGGEARRIAAPSGGVSAVATAVATSRGSGIVVFAAPTLDGATGADDDLRRRQARKDAGVTAILHESGPVRYWDHDLGPDSPRLLLAEIPGAGADEDLLETRDLTPDPGRALDENSFEVTPDGTRVVTGWSVWDEAGNETGQVEVIDTATGQRQTLLAAPGCDFGSPRISPDGRLVACIRAVHDSYEAPGDITLVITPLDGRRTARATCWPAWTGARSRPPGRRIPGRSTSPRTTRAGARCSAPTWRPGRSPG